MTEAFAARADRSPADLRPRISAASFRSLTDRLRKSSVLAAIPDLAPVAVTAEATQQQAVPADAALPPENTVWPPPRAPVSPPPFPVISQDSSKVPPHGLPPVWSNGVSQGAPLAVPDVRFELPEFVPLDKQQAPAGVFPQWPAAPVEQAGEHGGQQASGEVNEKVQDRETVAREHVHAEAASAPAIEPDSAIVPEPSPDPALVAEPAPETAPQHASAQDEETDNVPGTAFDRDETSVAAETAVEAEAKAAAEPIAAVTLAPEVPKAPESPEVGPASQPGEDFGEAEAAEAALQQPAADLQEPAPPEDAEADHADAKPARPHAPAVPAENASEAARKEHLSRKEAQELEFVWRSLLANPTIEERAAFVREVAESVAAETGHLPAPLPEHDLSTIAPAAVGVGAEEENAEPVAPFVSTAAAIVTDLAPEQSPNSDSAELARSLLDMMSSGSNSGLPHERALAADTLLRLVPKLGVKPLVMMAQRLAKADNPPALLVAKLIRDPRVEIAGPLLEDCPQITDKDLETVVSEGSAAKLRMLARRRHLTAAISDALIRTHDSSVLLTLVRNMDAAISQEGFQALIAAAEQDKELQAPLCTRPDFPAPLAFELFWSAPPQLRRFILSRFLTDSETLSKILKITLSTNDSEDMQTGDSNNQHMLLEALERAARGKIEVAADELAQVLQIAPATAARILHDAEGEPLVVMLKVAGYPRQALGGLLRRFSDAELTMLSSGRDTEELQSIFDTLSFNKARILLTYWDWATRKTGPYAPLH